MLGRMLRLAYEHNRLAGMPVMRNLEESAPRQGFFEPEAFAAVRRRSAGTLSLDPGATKNGEGR